MRVAANQTNILTATPTGGAVAAGWRRRSGAPARRGPSLEVTRSRRTGFELPQATSQRAAVRAVLLTDVLQVQAAAQVLFEETASFGTTAELACGMDSFAAHASSSAFNPRFVKDAVSLTLTMVGRPLSGYQPRDAQLSHGKLRVEGSGGG